LKIFLEQSRKVKFSMAREFMWKRRRAQSSNLFPMARFCGQPALRRLTEASGNLILAWTKANDGRGAV
jgi:hypothetical protein